MPNTIPIPAVVLVNLATGEDELLRACAGMEAIEAVPFRQGDAAARDLARASVFVTSTQEYHPETAKRLVNEARRLEWIHSPNTGLENFHRYGVPAGVRLSHMPGRAAAQVAEHAMALMLGLVRGLPLLERNRANAAWARERMVASMSSLIGRHLCLVGLGAIGRQVARRARAFGMKITAVATTARDDADVDRVVAVAELDAVLADADVLVLAVPIDSSTFHLLDARRLSLLKPSAILVNVSRGAVVDSNALVDALRARRLAGAGLDVFETEPLPKESPLWQLAEVLISPHVAGVGGPEELRVRALQIRQVLLNGISGLPLPGSARWVPDVRNPFQPDLRGTSSAGEGP
ncbi:phosphoglycerate dehydrogenase-like enzyme [Paraburkholderia sp. JPY465]|uniref:D-2-hydroxyacid dehydrogenase n=1 Tax=Paraburkholderia sp. JPY465 TaxID=3042285 RepID=UPI003D1ED1EC